MARIPERLGIMRSDNVKLSIGAITNFQSQVILGQLGVAASKPQNG